jgi:hypothetical protein
MKKLVAMGACSALFLVLNQVAAAQNLIHPVIYAIALIGGGIALILSVGEIFVMKAEQRLNEIEKENNKENSYTPKL